LGRSSSRRSPFRRHVAVPSDHGSWVFLVSPLLIGLFAGGRVDTPTAYLLVAAICGFLIRQPITIAVKIFSGRRSREDLDAALFWIIAYSLVGLLHILGLVIRGFDYVLYLLVPAAPVFVWYLILVSRRAERRQMMLEVVASGALALTAPAAMWVGLGRYDSLGWMLWLLTWAQSAASIVYTYVRLEQRVRPVEEAAVVPHVRTAILLASFNLIAVIGLWVFARISPWLVLAFVPQWLEVLWGVRHPATGQKPKTIGMRQLAISTLYTALFLVGVRG
jgi:hypothetical protein